MNRFAFLLRTAWRDGRRNIGKLFLFMSSIILGIAALVAINSFNDNLTRDIDREAAALLGADLVVTGSRPAGPLTLATLDSLPAERSTEVELLSMAFIPKANESQFVRLRALEGDFPYYGELVTDPPEANMLFRKEKGVIIEKGLMLQYELQVGDSLRLGTSVFPILGSFENAFASAAISSTFAPTVYIGGSHLDSTRLIQPGSLVNYSYYFKVQQPFDADQWEEEKSTRLRTESMRIETVSERQEDVTEAFSQLNYFLNLVGLVALLLGCIGVASSIFIYVKTKIPSIAIFRCLGMKGREAFLIYLIQVLALGLVGVLIGAGLGAFVQMLLPELLSDFLPLTINMQISWPSIFQGIGLGLLITSLFALLPLLAIRKVSPLRTLRATLQESRKRIDLVQAAVSAGIVLSLFVFLWLLTGEVEVGFFFVLGLTISFAILFGVAQLIMWFLKKYFPRQWNFVFRQGLANLFRPNNQTRTLLVSIGLGTAVLTTLFIVQGLLLRNVEAMDAGEQPNVFLFGIESNQIDTLISITEGKGMPIMQQMPIVTMRLEGWQGRSKADWLQDTTRKARNWAIHRETRATYRDYLDANEEVIEGEFPHPRESPEDSIFISLADAFAEAMAVEIGDEMVFDLQGMPLTTYVRSIRKIDNANMRARFLVLFPSGVLEDAPQFHVLVSKAPDREMIASYRGEVVKAFPNVSVLDLSTILQSVNEILNKISYILQFMALFSIVTGIIVLLSSLLLSKYQRIKESVLLRTIGASRRQIRWINATEYLLLGGLAALVGVMISLIAGFLIARFQFELDYTIKWLPILIVFTAVVLITLLIGVFNSREVVNKPPLAVLRKEVG